MIVTEEMKKQYDEIGGYIVFENFFDADEMRAVTERIDILDAEQEMQLRLIGHQGISIPNQINFTALLHQKDEAIREFTKQDKFVKLSTELLGPDTKLYWDQSVYKRPEGNRDFPWHQDTSYTPIVPQHYMTCWIALEDATVENGCIWVMPGTHKLGLVEHKETDVGKQCYFGDEPGIPVELKKGGMLTFNSLLFHRSTPNLSRSTRKAFIVQYSPIGAKHPETGVVYENGPDIARAGKAV